MKAPLLALALCSTLLAACAPSTRQVLRSDKSQTELRSFQTRAFATTDRNKMLRAIIATLQDLSFVVDNADEVLGTVTATKLSGYGLRMTVTVRPRGEKQLLVRANVQFEQRAVEDPKPYQNFFTALGKSLFLQAQAVD